MIEVWTASIGHARRPGSATEFARVVLGALLHLKPHLVPLRRSCRRCGSTEHGKPYVLGHPIHFSASAAGNRAAVATGPGPLGIDLVRLADIGPDAAYAILGDEEWASDSRALATLWARKEAILKATGDGLAIDPRDVRVSPPDAAAALLAWPGGSVGGLHVVDFKAPSQDDYVSSVAWLSGPVKGTVAHRDATALLRGRS